MERKEIKLITKDIMKKKPVLFFIIKNILVKLLATPQIQIN